MPAALQPSPEDQIIDQESAYLDEEGGSPDSDRENAISRLDQVVRALGDRLRTEFERRKGNRATIEARWQADLDRYNAIYDKATKSVLDARKYGSKTFVPLTRRICNMIEARLGDLLFPTDDRNFVVKEGPVPELHEIVKLAKQLPPEQMLDTPEGQVPAGDMANSSTEILDEARRRATNMQRAIDDQLKECNYPTEARKAIHDALKLGTGVIKGPVVFGRMKRRWVMQGGKMVKQVSENLNAAAARVDPWNYYGDLDATEVSNCQGHYERHRMGMAQLAALPAEQGFDQEAIARIITTGIENIARDGLLDAQRGAAGNAGVESSTYNLIEFNGSVTAEELTACGCDLPEDPLLAYNAVVWFSESTGDVVKAVLAPLDSDWQPYSIFNWQKDSACIYGYGLPYELADLQDGANSVFRAIQDNVGLTVGPQVVVNQDKIAPVDGAYVIEPNKVWEVTDPTVSVNNVFAFYQIESHVDKLIAVFNLIKALADETGGPALAMAGSEAPSFAQAGATGMSIAYNSASVWMRRAVRNWDDQVTTPLIGRFVDWNMENNPDEDIKGDVAVVSRGTSALMEAEGQAQRIAMLMQAAQAAGIPLRRVINQLRQMALAMRLDPDDLLPDDEEIKAMEEQQKQNGPPPNPELERIKLRGMELEDNDKQREHDRYLADQAAELRLAELAQKDKITTAEARLKYGVQLRVEAAKLDDRERQRAFEGKRFNTEIALATASGRGI